MSRTSTLVAILLLTLMMLFSACANEGDNAARGDDDSNNIPNLDDDSGGDDDDDDDDDDSGDGRVHIIAPENGATILGYQVSVEVLFDDVPDQFQLTLDGVDVTYMLNYFSEERTAWADIPDVPEGNHQLILRGWYGDDEDSDQVDFATTLHGGMRIELALSDYMLPPGGTTTASWVVYDENNQDITDQVTVNLMVEPTDGVTLNGNNITFNKVGAYTVTAFGEYNGQNLSDATQVVVYDAGDIDHVVIDCSPTTITAGESVQCTAVIYDNEDNEVAGTVYYSVDPPEGATINGGTITLTHAPKSTITGTVAGTDISDSQQINVNVGPAYDVTLSLDPTTIKVGETTTATANIVDKYGNTVPGEVDLEVSPDDGVVIDGMEITVNKAGSFTVTAWDAAHTMQAQAVLLVTESSPPHIEITFPERGAFLQTASINLQGRVWDDYGAIEELTVNGTEVYFNPETGVFSTTVTLLQGLNVILLEATDDSGNTADANTSVLYAGSYLPNGDMVDDAIGARITPTGFDSIEGVAEDLIESYRSEIMGMIPNPLFEESIDLLIVEVTASATANSIDYEPIQVELTPQGGGLHLSASTTSLEVLGTVSVDISDDDQGKASYDFSVTATSVSIDGDLIVSASGGALQVQLINVAVSINGLNVEVDDPGWLTEVLNWIISLFTGIVQDELESVLTDMINNTVPPLLEELFNGLTLAFDFDILDFAYHFLAEFSDVDFDVDGGEIWLSAYATYGDGSWAVGENTPDLPGSLFTPDTRPVLGQYIPDTSTPYGFAAILSDDIINQILHVAHRSGLLSLNLDQETLEELGIDDFQLTTTWLVLFMPGIVGEYGLNKNVEVRLRPKLPPVMIMNPAEKALDTEIQMGDFVLEWWCEKQTGVWEKFMDVALALFVPTAISVDDTTQTISLAFGDIEMYADLFNAPVFEINDSFVEDLLPNLVQLLVPALLNGLLESIPIPSFEGFTLQVNAFLPVGAAEDFAGLFGDLIKVSVDSTVDLPVLNADLN